MELSKIGGLESVLGASSATSGAAAAGAPGATSFLDVLKKSLDHVNSAQASADTTAQQFQTGQNDVSLEDAMISMQKANISFQAAVQVRNKLVSAYTDIMNMQI